VKYQSTRDLAIGNRLPGHQGDGNG
jgi:hypothetical protein